ncbi:unnamed protein product, partial [marine sediment metagenome]
QSLCARQVSLCSRGCAGVRASGFNRISGFRFYSGSSPQSLRFADKWVEYIGRMHEHGLSAV